MYLLYPSVYIYFCIASVFLLLASCQKVFATVVVGAEEVLSSSVLIIYSVFIQTIFETRPTGSSTPNEHAPVKRRLMGPRNVFINSSPRFVFVCLAFSGTAPHLSFIGLVSCIILAKSFRFLSKQMRTAETFVNHPLAPLSTDRR